LTSTSQSSYTSTIVPDSNEATPLPIPEDADLLSRAQFPLPDPLLPPDPDKPAWGVVGAVLLWLASIVLQIIIPLLALIPYALHRGLNPGSPGFALDLAEFAMGDPRAILLQVVSIFPIHIVTLALLWALVTRLGKRPFLASLGWSWPEGLGLWRSVAVGVALFGAAWLIALLFGGDKPTKMEELISSSAAARYSIAVLAVFTAPFIEEFIYRGVLYSALQRLIGVKGAVIIVLGLFTLIHVPQYWPNFGVIAAVGLLSVALTLVRAYSGKLLPCVVIHMVFNLIQSVILLFEPYLHQSLPPTPVPPPVSLLLPLVGIHF
jgi:CAAX protease family protein